MAWLRAGVIGGLAICQGVGLHWSWGYAVGLRGWAAPPSAAIVPPMLSLLPLGVCFPTYRDGLGIWPWALQIGFEERIGSLDIQGTCGKLNAYRSPTLYPGTTPVASIVMRTGFEASRSE